MTAFLIIGYIVLGMALAVALFIAIEAVKRAASRLRAIALVLRRAAEWAAAEQALRDGRANGMWNDPWSGEFNEEKHRLSLASDVTEQTLLEAVQAAEELGLDLRSFNALS